MQLTRNRFGMAVLLRVYRMAIALALVIPHLFYNAAHAMVPDRLKRIA